MSLEREEFEEWARSVSDNYFPDFSADGVSDGGYWQIRTDTAWKAWQACAELKDAEIAKLREELGVCRHANQQHSEQIARLRDNIRSYGDAQVWYTHALAVLRHVRYASSELLDVVDAHNRFAKACVGQVIVPEKQIADVRDALIKSDEFFAPDGGTPS